MATAERDIELVLITGAGASCDLGTHGRRLPLMPEWSNHLIERLAGAGGHYVQMTGLSRDLDGPTFEETLGRFLAARTAFPRVQEIVAESAGLQFSDQHLNANGVLEGWHRELENHLQQIDKAIRGSLYDLFGEPQYDLQGAEGAYKNLLDAIGGGIGTTSRWVYATTNYDPIGEEALQRLGYRVEWGTQRQARNTDPPIDVDGMVTHLGRYVPVLHLHGRIGWYWRTEGVETRAYELTAKTYNEGFGTPVVMLPDPAKAYDSDDVISAIWREFIAALDRAKRVLVLGHSLHDEALVEALATHVLPQPRLAVSVLSDPGNPSVVESENDPTIRIVKDRLPEAFLVPARFGTTPMTESGALNNWNLALANAGL